jgi:plastocyanin
MTKRALVVVLAIFAMILISAAPSALAGGGGCHSPATEAKGTAVEIKDACFTPTNLHVQPGDQVTWVNRDSFSHVVAGTGGTWGRFDGMGKGARLTFRFDHPGVYAYTCFLHPGMNGTVIVGKVKTPSSTIEDLGVAAPTEIVNPQPPANPVTEPPAAPVSTTSEASNPWRAVWFVVIGLLLGAAGTLVTQRLGSRRSRLPVAAG